MDTTVRVWNYNNFDIGIKLFAGREVNIRAHSFYPMSEDDIAYISSVSDLFEKGRLRVEKEEDENRILSDIGIDKNAVEGFLDDTEIQKRLNGNYNKVKTWIDTLSDKVLIDRVNEIAKKMDLPASKMKLIAAKAGRDE